MSPPSMSSAPLANGRRGQPLAALRGDVTPGALDVARVLAVCERRQEQIAVYLPAFRQGTVEALEELGYREIDAQLAGQPPACAEVAVAAALSVLMKLPGSELKRPDFSLNLPLALTYGGELRISGAEIGGFAVRETFVHSLEADPAQVALAMTHGLSRLYMAHLLKTGGWAAPAQGHVLRPVALVGEDC